MLLRCWGVRVTFLSNGYGEDAVGALLLGEMRERRLDARFAAFPTVDAGRAYEPLGVPILGPRRVMPSGGLLLHSPALFWRDVRAGFLGMTGRQLGALRSFETDLLIVVGDVYALLLSNLVRTRARYYVQPLVSVYHGGGNKLDHRLNRRFMETFTGLERSLIRRTVAHTYVRDAPTAVYLKKTGLNNVSALGNPMLDMLKPQKALNVPLTSPIVTLLPGTRAYAEESLERMLMVLSLWPEATGLVAWAREALPRVEGWGLEPPNKNAEHAGVYARGAQRVFVLKDRFADILHAADLALGTAGTANEQAAALGLPVVAFPVPPFYTRSFLENQKRLLSDALTLSAPEPNAVAVALKKLWGDRDLYERAARAGRERMGEPGGTRAIIKDILRREGLGEMGTPLTSQPP